MSLGPVGVAATPDLEAAVRQTDLIPCATTATEPLIRGEWLKPGGHLDLMTARFVVARAAESDAS